MKRAYRKFKLKTDPKKRITPQLESTTYIALKMCSKLQGKTDSEMLEEILDKHYSQNFNNSTKK